MNHREFFSLPMFNFSPLPRQFKLDYIHILCFDRYTPLHRGINLIKNNVVSHSFLEFIFFLKLLYNNTLNK